MEAFGEIKEAIFHGDLIELRTIGGSRIIVDDEFLNLLRERVTEVADYYTFLKRLF